MEGGRRLTLLLVFGEQASFIQESPLSFCVALESILELALLTRLALHIL